MLSTHRYMLDVLKSLEAQVVPAPHHHHAIMCLDGKLTLQLSVGVVAQWRSFILGPEDADKSAEVLVAEIVDALHRELGVPLIPIGTTGGPWS